MRKALSAGSSSEVEKREKQACAARDAGMACEKGKKCCMQCTKMGRKIEKERERDEVEEGG